MALDFADPIRTFVAAMIQMLQEMTFGKPRSRVFPVFTEVRGTPA